MNKLFYKYMRDYNNKQKLIDKYKLAHKCDCGHTLIFNYKDDKKLCNCCGKIIYKDKKTEFKYLLSNRLYK